MSLSTRFLLVLSGGLLAGQLALGVTANGNEFALFYSEAKGDVGRKAILDEALGKQHFFRYLRITEMEEGEENGFPFITVTTCEPSSKMTVKFRVRKTMSLIVLKQDPPSKVGDALAVTGVVRGADQTTKTIIINPVIVRYKDRLTRKPGKEMLEEVDSSAIVYSYTGGKEPANVSARDKDLVRNEEQMLAKLGPDGWSKYLRGEIAKRDKAAAEIRNKLKGIYRRDVDDDEEALPEKSATTPAVAAEPANAPTSVLTEDED
jgi:hypothetical protein